MASMFGSKKHFDLKKLVVKLQDTNKNVFARIKSLKNAIVEAPDVEAIEFLRENYRLVFFLISDAFEHIEHVSAKNYKKGDDVDLTIDMFERLIIEIPDQIYTGWQLNGTGRLIKRLLHPSNIQDKRETGIKLFLSWYCILGDKAMDFCHQTFHDLIPCDINDNGVNLERDFIFTANNCPLRIAPAPLSPVVQVVQNEPINCRVLMSTMLENLTSCPRNIHWSNSSQKLIALNFLINRLKNVYFMKLFKDSFLYSIYTDNKPPYAEDKMIIQSPIDEVRISLLEWLSKFSSKLYADNPEDTLIHNVIFSSRKSIDIILDIFRYVFLLPLSNYKIKLSLFKIYSSWFVPSERLEYSPRPVFFDANKVDLLNENFVNLPLPDEIDNRIIYVPTQKAIVWYIIHVSAILLPYHYQDHFDRTNHAYLVNCVLYNFNNLAMNVKLEKNTWKELLIVLLRSIKFLIRRDNYVGIQTARDIFNTLFNIWLKAAQTVEIEKELWNDLLILLKSLTGWKELIQEWSLRMNDLTSELASIVYGVQLPDSVDKRNGKYLERTRYIFHRREDTDNYTNFSPKKLLKEVRQMSGDDGQLSKWHSDGDLTSTEDNNSPANTLPRVASHTSVVGLVDAIPSSPKPIKTTTFTTTTSTTTINKPITSIIDRRDNEAAIILWRRFLGILGNINQVEDPNCYFEILIVIEKILNSLSYVRKMLSDDCKFYPPTIWFASWLFGSLRLNNSHKDGKIIAMKLLCKLLLDDPKARNSIVFVNRFIYTVHNVLVSDDPDLRNTIVQVCSSKILTTDCSGLSLLSLDLTEAALKILDINDSKKGPRTDAIRLLFGLYNVHNENLPALDTNCYSPLLTECKNLKERIIKKTLDYSKSEKSEQTRNILLNSIATFAYNQLNDSVSDSVVLPDVKETINILLATVNTPNLRRKSPSRIACDLLIMIAEKVDFLLDDTAGKIIDSLLQTYNSLIKNRANPVDNKLTAKIISALVEWIHRCSISMLLDNGSGAYQCLLLKAFNAFQNALYDDSFSSKDIDENSTVTYQIEIGDIDLEDATDSNQRASVADLKIAAEAAINQVINLLGLWPMGGGAALLHSHIMHETHDNIDGEDDLSSAALNHDNLQWLVSNGNSIISAIQLPNDLSSAGGTAGLSKASNQARFIIRNFVGKFCWDATLVYGTSNMKSNSAKVLLSEQEITNHNNNKFVILNRPNFSGIKNEHFANDYNQLDKLLNYLETTSPELKLKADNHLDEPFPLPAYFGINAIAKTRGSLLKQSQSENDWLVRNFQDISLAGKEALASESLMLNNNIKIDWPFTIGRLFLWHLAYGPIDRRNGLDVLEQNDNLIRSLKNIDKQLCRETHKIGLLYASVGQKQKSEMFDNDTASKRFEQMVSGLGWDVQLANHSGFTGGLSPRNGISTYYATPSNELMWHVSTRMPSGTDELRHLKLKHLGNDEVLVVFLEKGSEFDRQTLRTDFSDVLIKLHSTNAYRKASKCIQVSIDTKRLNFFVGPLYDGCIVQMADLPELLRASVLNASRRHRMSLPHFKAFYEERADYVLSLVEGQRRRATFEEYSESILAPVLPSISVPYVDRHDLPAENIDHISDSNQNNDDDSVSVDSLTSSSSTNAINTLATTIISGKSKISKLKLNNRRTSRNSTAT